MITDLPAILGILINFALGIYAIINLKKESIISFGILFYFITLAPTSNFFFNNGATMAERFMYTPSLGFCIILTYLLIKFTCFEKVKSNFKNLSQFLFQNSKLFIILSIIILLYSIRTFSRSMDWKNNVTIFEHDVEISKNSATAHIWWGRELLRNFAKNENNPEIKKSYLRRSIIEFDQALNILDTLPFLALYNDKGCALAELERYDESIIAFQKEIEKYPNNPDVYYNLGISYIKKGDNQDALKAFNGAIKINPKDPESHFQKGLVLFYMNNYLEAIPEFQFCISMNYKNLFSYKNICISYIKIEQYENALKFLNTAISLFPNDSDYVKYLGITYKKMGDTLKSKEYLEKAKMMGEGQQR